VEVEVVPVIRVERLLRQRQIDDMVVTVVMDECHLSQAHPHIMLAEVVAVLMVPHHHQQALADLAVVVMVVVLVGLLWVRHRPVLWVLRERLILVAALAVIVVQIRDLQVKVGQEVQAL
jgi:hypothetical protein